MRFVKSTILLPIILYLASCADGIVSQCETDDSGVIVHATFSSIQRNVFTPTCARSGCHSGLQPTGGLNLERENAYNNLFDVQSTEESALKRVEAGNSANSFLIIKLNGQGTSEMPPSGKLQQAVIDSIAAWIDDGALNN